MRLLVLPLATTLATHALADDHGGKLAFGVGDFISLMGQARHPDAYTELMKQNTSLSEAHGSSVAGVCVTKTGASCFLENL